MVGTLSNVLSAKGYAFIAGENGQEYFFHMSDAVDWNAVVTNFVNMGGGVVKVTFEPEKTPKGPRARNVVINPVTG